MEFNLDELELESEDLDEEYGEEEEEETVGYVEEPEEEEEKSWKPQKQPEWSDAEKLDMVLDKIPGRRKILLNTLEFCREPKLVSDLDEYMNELQRNNYSVYTPVTLRRILEENGGIRYIAPEVDEEEDEDEEYIKPRPEGMWQTTEAGIEVLDEDNPYERITDLFDKDEEYKEIYERVLKYCAEEPRHKKEIDAIVDSDPLVQKPRRFAGYFISGLEKNDALDWKEEWYTTDFGKKVLEELF